MNIELFMCSTVLLDQNLISQIRSTFLVIDDISFSFIVWFFYQKCHLTVPVLREVKMSQVTQLVTFGLSTQDHPDPMRIGDPDPKTTLPPHGFNLDPSCMLCCVTVLRNSVWNPVQQCNARSGQIGNLDPANPLSVPVWRAPLISWHET